MRVAGYETLGNTGYRRKLAAAAAKNGASGIIEFLGAIPRRSELLRSASKAHLGIALVPKRSDDINLQHMVGASNKPFDYMACGLPLLVSDLPEWTETFVKPGYARACDPEDTDLIEAALRWYLAHPNESNEMGRRGCAKVRRDWNYDTLFSPILRELEFR